MTISATRISLGGAPVDLREFNDAVEYIASRATTRSRVALAVASVNLDHIHHFGAGSRWIGTLERAGSRGEPPQLEWLNLVDGAPLATQARRLTGHSWPRLAGSDLIGPIIARAERDGTRIGFFGGAESTHEQLRTQLAREHPSLLISGFWTPSRDDLGDPERSIALAHEVAAARTDLLVVALGKPRQELWIARHGAETGAQVLLAFGAVVDFLARRVSRAPDWVARHGLEWTWRLALEPRRLASRYLVEDPPAYLAVRRTREADAIPSVTAPPKALPSPSAAPEGRFSAADEYADIAVIVVTYNSADHVGRLLASLRRECLDLRLRVIVADNDSTDGTKALLGAESGVITVDTGGNLGYAGGVNAARAHAGATDAVLVLNADLTVERGALHTMLNRMSLTGAGAIVPRLLNADRTTYHSIRREPTVTRALGDALFGRRDNHRPGWLSEFDTDPESYQHAHRVDWATGAALLFRRDIAEMIGAWDERFFLYSEETDYLRRIRDAGATIWYEPEATMIHAQGGSGASPVLDALLTVNRVRYIRKHRSALYAAAFHSTVILHELLRSRVAVNRATLGILTHPDQWRRLPHSTRTAPTSVPSGHPAGSIIIPAHNEAAVIGRTLRALAPLAERNEAEIIVSCNGCTDATASIARTFPDVRVVEITESSKTAALNAGDGEASAWPRIYLDADIEITTDAVHAVFSTLSSGNLLAARPAFRYDTTGASPLVRAYYRARGRMPSMHSALWGAGVYAVNAAGHDRFGAFPALTADDLFVDTIFTSDEKTTLDTVPVRVRTPRSIRGLIAVLTRQHRGTIESSSSSTTVRSMRELAWSVRGPASAWDALTYAALTGTGRVAAARSRRKKWERDDSSR
ncbi:WecB/TagA/CpsF family glycosyltransferase [Cryobacterium sp. TMT1-19]|uniref:WecB/TagA/CpsF family glycosyltransferase n=1 Tax=Cryobacterium sp. TMT1-19 TaxID=1259231 RepID=UPI00141AE72F|nr:WecB/TagA/CpsF family glycosyltransferase [Cryobacterium sp. TMT1-19]